MSDRAPTAPPGPILIVEDEPKLAQLLVDYLKAAGLESVAVHDGRQALPAVHQHQPALLLLDLMLPGLDGVSICRELRQFSRIPVIMLTARVEEVDRLLGLDVGADDYLCKPYSPREVVARVQAQLRRQQWQRAEALPPGTADATPNSPPPAGLQLDDGALRAHWGPQVLDLTPGEYRLLRALVRLPGRVLSREQLLDHLHDDGRAITDRTVDSHVRNLRRKLEAAGASGELIRSVYGAGYAWEGSP